MTQELTQQEKERYEKLLLAVFGPGSPESRKPAPPVTPIPDYLQPVLAVAAKYEDLPVIVIKSEPSKFTGRLDLNSYNCVAIVVATRHMTYEGDEWYGPLINERTIPQQQRTLAHELGHLIGKFYYETHGFKAAEDGADAWADRLLTEAGLI